MLGLGPISGAAIAAIGGILYTTSITDSLTTSESFANVVVYPTTITDSLTPNESFGGGVLYTTTSDSLTTNESFANVVVYPTSINDSLTTNESFANVVVYPTSINDSLTTNELFILAPPGSFVILLVESTVGQIISAEESAATLSVTMEYTDTLGDPATSHIAVSEQQSRT